MHPAHPAAERFVRAVAARDFATLGACLDPQVRFRALVPSGSREADTAEGAIALLRRWFGDADRLEVLASTVDRVADRLHLAWRFYLREGGDWFVIEQQAYCDLDRGRITSMHLLCSGFRPAP